MQVISGLMSCILGAAGFTGCTARALCINFVNSTFPFKGEVSFGSYLSQASHLQELDVGPWFSWPPSSADLHSILCSLSLAQSLGSAIHKWKGHVIPQAGEVSFCQGSTWYLSKLPTVGTGRAYKKRAAVFRCACDYTLFTLSASTSPF